MLHHKRIWLIVVLICALLGGSALAGELSGGFDDSSISLIQGETARVSGWAQTSGAGLTRVTLTVDGYHTSDGNDRYASREFGGETSISLQDYGEFTLDSSSAPLNEPGSYTVHLWAADEEGSKELAKIKVTVEAPPAEEEPEFEEETWEDDAGEDYVEEYSEEEYYEDEPVDEPSEEEYVEDEPTPAPLPVEINGGLDSDHVEVTLGELATVDGWVEVSNGTLNRVTLTVSGYQTGDGNDRYASREFGGESSIELGNYVEFTLDTTREPLNQPGSYTVNLWAAASDGSSSELGSMAVDVVAPPEPEPEPEPEPGTEPEREPDPNAVILEDGVALSGGFDEDSVELRVGESRRVAGEVSVQGGSLAQVTYQIDGWSGDDENNRYCTQEVSDASSVKLENMAGLVLDANAAPLNEPGEYTLHLVARAASGEFAELDAMTVSILPQDIAAPTYSPEEGGATVRATGDAYVRTAPDKDSPDMGSVGAGTELSYLGESQTDGRGVTWYKVSFGGAEGWISSNVSQRSIDSSKHSPEEPPKPAPAVTGGTASGTVYITGDINARLAPDPDGDILCTISSGTTLEYLGETSTDYRGIDWYRASYNGNAVWLSSRYAELEAEQPAPEPVPEPEEVAIAGEFSDDSIEMTVGQRMLVAGNVSASGDVLAQITYQIDGWSGTDANNRYCTQAVDGLQSVQLTELSELILDGTTAPLNQPGEYTLRLIASTSNGSWQQLDSMAVMVKECSHEGPKTYAQDAGAGEESYQYIDESKHRKVLLRLFVCDICGASIIETIDQGEEPHVIGDDGICVGCGYDAKPAEILTVHVPGSWELGATVQFTWNALSNVDGYEVFCKLFENSANAKDSNGGSVIAGADPKDVDPNTTSYGVTLQSDWDGKCVKVAVRAYNIVNEKKYYSGMGEAYLSLEADTFYTWKDEEKMVFVGAKEGIVKPNYGYAAGSVPQDPNRLAQVIHQFNVKENYGNGAYCNKFLSNLTRAMGAFVPMTGDSICRRCGKVIEIQNDYNEMKQYFETIGLICNCSGEKEKYNSILFDPSKEHWERNMEDNYINDTYKYTLDVARWLIEYGREFGWEAINPTTAEEYINGAHTTLDPSIINKAIEEVNKGYLVIGVWSQFGKSGHAFVAHPHPSDTKHLYTTQVGAPYQGHPATREDSQMGDGGVRACNNGWILYYVFKGVGNVE